MKWIYRFANEKNKLWRKVVSIRSGVDPNIILLLVTKSSRKSTLINLIKIMLDRNESY